MAKTSGKAKASVAITAAVLGAVPVILYLIAIERAPSVTPAEALRFANDGSAVLVDVRSPQAFGQQRIAYAVNWPMDDILALGSASELPEGFRGKRLLLLCDSGITSVRAAQKLRRLGLADVFSVAGGISACTMDGRVPCPMDFLRGLFAGSKPAPLRESPVYEQLALVSTGFGVKPFYMTVSFLLAVVLWRAASPDLVALRWSMIFFFLGEAFCAVNYLAFNLQSHFTEYLHSYGMVLGFGFFAYAAFEGMDLRIIRLSDPAAKCAALNLCRTCTQRTGGPCGLERSFLWLSAAMFVLAFIPLCAPPHAVSYNTVVFGTPYNYSHPVIYQIFETKYCPLLALLFFAACFGVLAFKKTDRVPLAKILFAAGMGPLSFSLFRLLLFGVFRDNLVWFNFWEEITEWVFVMGIVLTLWIFRSTLFPKRPQPVSE